MPPSAPMLILPSHRGTGGRCTWRGGTTRAPRAAYASHRVFIHLNPAPAAGVIECGHVAPVSQVSGQPTSSRSAAPAAGPPAPPLTYPAREEP